MLFSTPPKIPAQQGFLVVVRHVVTKHRSDLRLSPNLQVLSNVILSRVGAILLVSCTLQTRALVHTHGGTVPKRTYLVLNLVLKKIKIFSMKKIQRQIYCYRSSVPSVLVLWKSSIAQFFHSFQGVPYYLLLYIPGSYCSTIFETLPVPGW